MDHKIRAHRMALSAAPETGKFLYPARRPELELHRDPRRIRCRPARPSDLSASLWDHRNDTPTDRQGTLYVRSGTSLWSTPRIRLEGPPVLPLKANFLVRRASGVS